MKSFLILNGPNLNMLGTREPHIYGSKTLADIEADTKKYFESQNVKVNATWFQSNIEGELVERIQKSLNENFDALIINPGGYSHTSVAILDALKMVNIPVLEVHLSNTHHREGFRSIKMTAKASTIIMEGLGPKAYQVAIQSQL